jgi:flagellar biosynthesis/type III secretory pathway protein FliH
VAVIPGRVIRQDEALRATRVPPEPPASRVLLAAEVAAHEQAQAIVEAAEHAAATLRASARAEVERVREAAEREGRLAAEAALAARWIQLKIAEDQALAAREADVLLVARALAERLLGRALEVEPLTVVSLAREALGAVRRARRVRLFAHPDDAPVLQAHLPDLGIEASFIEVHLDPTCPRGGLRADTDFGTVVAHLAPQLDRLIAALRGRVR